MNRITGHFPANGYLNSLILGNIGQMFQHSQDCRIQWLEKMQDILVAPIDGERILN